MTKPGTPESAAAYTESLRKRAEDAKASADHRALVIADLTRKVERSVTLLRDALAHAGGVGGPDFVLPRYWMDHARDFVRECATTSESTPKARLDLEGTATGKTVIVGVRPEASQAAHAHVAYDGCTLGGSPPPVEHVNLETKKRTPLASDDEPTGKHHCGDPEKCQVGPYAEDACECSCCTRCGPWNEYLEARKRAAGATHMVGEIDQTWGSVAWWLVVDDRIFIGNRDEAEAEAQKMRDRHPERRYQVLPATEYGRRYGARKKT